MLHIQIITKTMNGIIKRRDTYGSALLIPADTSLWLKGDNPLNTDIRWYDASPNNHIFNGTATLTDNVLNSQKGYVFNGSTNYFNGGDILDIGLNSRTIYYVSKDTNQLVSPMISKYASGLNGEWYIDGFQTGLNHVIFTPLDVRTPAINYGTTFFGKYRFVVDRQSAIIKTKYLTTESTYPFNFPTTNLNCSADLKIGEIAGYWLNGTICEILLYDRLLTTDEDAQVNAYLNTKYGL